MKNINFKITDTRVKNVDMIRFTKSGLVFLGKLPICVAKITVSFQKPNGKDCKINYDFGSDNTDKEHFNDFLADMKNKLLEIFEKAESFVDIRDAERKRFVKNGCIYITDIK